MAQSTETGANTDAAFSASALDAELAALQIQVRQLQAENARLLRLIELTPEQARPPGPVQTGIFDAAPGSVHIGSPPSQKVAFFAALFSARTDVYAVRWENARSGKSGWMPAVRGGWRWIDGGMLGKETSRSEVEFAPGPELTVAAALAGYRARAASTDDLVRTTPLTEPCLIEEGADLRRVLLHLINETARHAGHADATRELLDATTGA